MHHGKISKPIAREFGKKARSEAAIHYIAEILDGLVLEQISKGCRESAR